MRVGIIGSGRVGCALAGGWIEAGHEVVFGSRTPEAVAARVEGKVRAAGVLPLADAGAFGPVVVLATPFGALAETLASLGHLTDQVLVDCTNPMAPDLARLRESGFASGGERVAAWASGARVVKCFNITGSANLAHPLYGNDPLTMPLCGNDAESKAVTARLAGDLGFDPVDVGGLDACSLLEAAALLWIRLAYTQGLGPNIGWKLLRR